MVLTMLVPVLLVPGAPVTLAMRAIAKRDDGIRGAREWILLAVHSKFAGVIANPIVAAVLFAGSLWVFYYSPLFRWAMTDHIGHEWMIVHFLLTGYLFVQSLIGIDPVPYRLPYPLRLLLLLATMAVPRLLRARDHVEPGCSSPTGSARWDAPGVRRRSSTSRSAAASPGASARFRRSRSAITVAIQWSRSDTQGAKRLDRNADRTGDAELKAYNERLARMAGRGLSRHEFGSSCERRLRRVPSDMM